MSVTLNRVAPLAASIACAVLAIPACSSASPAKVRSLCTVLDPSNQPVAQRLELRVTVLSDALHAESVQDPACPKKGAELRMSESAVQNGSAERLRSAVMKAPAGTLEKKIEIVVQGHLLREVRDSRQVDVLVADEIMSIDVQP